MRGVQDPRVSCWPGYVASSGREALDLARSVGLWLDPWQALVLDHALGERADGKWSAFECAVIVPRQNGKGGILEARELAGLFLFGEQLILHSAHEFKDLDLSTPILTVSGWSTMGELVAGDEVFAPDGQPTKVLAAHSVIPDSDCYRVTFADGQSLVAGGGHLWDVTEVDRDGWTCSRVVTTEGLRRAGLVHHWDRPSGRDRNVYRWRLALPGALQAPDADLPVPPYLLGAWLGDGDSRGGRLTVGARDLAHFLGEFAALGESCTVSPDSRWPDRVSYVGVSGLKARLRIAGVLGAKRIPQAYLVASEAQRRALLAGIMDTDGTVSGHQLAVTMTKLDLMVDILELIRSLGYRATLREFRARRHGCDAGPMYRVQFAPTDVSPFRMSRKTEAIRRLKTSRSAYNAIVSIDRVPIRSTRCITVAHESGCYLAGRGFIPTHNTAQEAFRRIMFWIEGKDWMRKRVLRVRTSHGEEGIELHPPATVITGSSSKRVSGVSNGARLRFVARSTGSGRGFSGDVVILDEAYNLGGEAMAALLPTLSARENPQIWYTSSAGMESSEQLLRVHERGVKGDSPRLAYFEWSADPTLDLDDRVGWAQANPALGYRVREEFIEAERAALPGMEFGRERLGYWPSERTRGVIPVASWSALADPASKALDPVVFAAAASPDHGRGSIAAVGARADGYVHVELVENREGTHWMLGRLVELSTAHRPRGVVVDPASGAGALIPGLQQAGVEPVLVTGRAFAQACGAFYDAVMEAKSVRHVNQPGLNAALSQLSKRPSGDAWVFDRRNPGGDITPVDAVALGLQGHSTLAGQNQFFVAWR